MICEVPCLLQSGIRPSQFLNGENSTWNSYCKGEEPNNNANDSRDVPPIRGVVGRCVSDLHRSWRGGINTDDGCMDDECR